MDNLNLPVYNSTPGVSQTQPINNTPTYQPNVTPVYNNNNGPSYANDKVAISYTAPMNNPMVNQSQGNQTVQVGMMDKVSVYFKDVYRSDANIAAYKAFTTDLKANSGNYMQEGSTDKNRISDLQQKLNILGIKCNVNGTFGAATASAVSEFKEFAHIDDGYLDKKGQPARTGIVTPQTWSILDSMVTKKLNPNAPIAGNGNPTPVTQDELLWAQNLQQKIKTSGYKPTQKEYLKYNDIRDRAQGQQQMQQVSQPQQMTVSQTQQPAYTSAPTGGVTQEELTWAMNLQTRADQGYKPTAQETEQFNDIYSRYSASGQNVQAAQTAPTQAVSEEEYNWAMTLQNKVDGGYKATANEIAQFNDIYGRYQQYGKVQPQQVQNTQATQNTQSASNVQAGGLSANAVVLGNAIPEGTMAIWKSAVSRGAAGLTGNWNSDRGNLYWVGPSGQVIPQAQLTQSYVNKNFNPQWKLVFDPGAGTVQNQPVQNTPVQAQNPNVQNPYGNLTQAEIDWASSLYDRAAQGYQPTAEEVAKFNDIQMRAIQSTQKPQSNVQSAQNMSVTVTQEEMNWAVDIQNRHAQGYQLTQTELNQYTDIFNRYQQAMANQTAPTTAASAMQTTQQPVQNTASVTQEEMNWALDLEKRASAGYKPTDAESARYMDIFTRAQSAGSTAPTTQTNVAAANTNTAVTNFVSVDASDSSPELQWALNLLERFRTGYQPSDDELRKYEAIIAQYKMPGATP